MVAILDNLPLDGKRVLMMLPQRNENVILSLRNIPSAKAQHVSSINVVELLKHDCLIMPVETVRWLEMVFGDGMSAEEASSKILEATRVVDASDGEVEAAATDNEEAEEA
jgi:large subunit ribosomal protein L4